MKTFLRLLGFLRPYRRGVIASFALAAAAMGTGVLIPYLVGRTVDEIRHGGDELWPLALVVVASALVSLAPMPLVIWVASRYGSRNRPASQEVQQRIAELTAEAEENVSGIRVVKAFARERRQLRRFEHAVRRVFDQSMVSARLRAFYSPLIGFLPQLGLAGLLLVGGRQAVDGTISIGDFVAFYGYVLMLTSPMRMLGIALGMSQRAVASGARVFEILDREPRLTSPPGAPPLPPGDGRVELRDVTFSYANAAPSLR